MQDEQPPAHPLDEPEHDESYSRWNYLLYLGIAICAAGTVGHFMHYFPAGAMLITCGLLVIHVRSTLLFILATHKEAYQYFFYAGRTLLVVGVSLVFWNYIWWWLPIAAALLFVVGMWWPSRSTGPLKGDDY